MSQKKESTAYVARPVDKNGNAAYTEEDNKVWRDLYSRQFPIVEKRACDEYMEGLRILNLPKDRVPQCPEISRGI